MRVAILCLFLAGCAGQSVHVGPDPTPGVGIRGLAHVSGAWDAQVLADQIPLTVLFKGSGAATITARMLPPYLTIDGAVDVLVEPVAGFEVEAQHAVQRGDVVIVRAGVVGLLNPPGSIAPKSPPPPQPPSFPPAGAVSSIVELCPGGRCAVPLEVPCAR